MFFSFNIRRIGIRLNFENRIRILSFEDNSEPEPTIIAGTGRIRLRHPPLRGSEGHTTQPPSPYIRSRLCTCLNSDINIFAFLLPLIPTVITQTMCVWMKNLSFFYWNSRCTNLINFHIISPRYNVNVYCALYLE